MIALLVVIGAAVGAAVRWWLDQRIQGLHDHDFPVGTWVVNISGSLLLGAVVGAVAAGTGGASLVALVGTGFCGGFTTFSAFGFESVRLAEEGARFAGTFNVVLSAGVGLLAAATGWAAATALLA